MGHIDPPRSRAAVADELEETLEAELASLETGILSSLEGLAERAAAVLAAAEAHRLGNAAGRARIVLADLTLRGGDLQGAMSSAQDVLAATVGVQARQVVASCAHALLGWGFSLLGLGDEALAHCLQAIQVLPPDGPEHLRIFDEVLFVLVQGLQLPGDGYRAGSAAAVEEAERFGQTDVLLDARNNAIWLDWRHGHLADALDGVARLEAVAAERGVGLSSTALDTVANVLLSAGDLDRAEQFNRAAVAPTATHVDINAPTDAMLTTVRLRRARGDLPGALLWADRTRELAQTQGLTQAVSEALQQQAEILAELGDHEQAYRVHVEFHRRWEQLRSELTDARAALLASEYDTERSRRESVRNAELAERDPLTGLWNRRRLTRLVPSLLAAAAARDEPLSLAIVDLDGFKVVNDDFSHDVGDSVLQAVARTILAAATTDGFAVRLGGDEFLLVLPGHDGPAARRICEQVREQLRTTDWHAVAMLAGPAGAGAGAGGAPVVTITVGIATALGPTPLADLLRAADTSLYRGKRAGRDRVGEPVPVPAPA